MGKLFIIIGKSASGKDTIYKRLLEDPQLGLRPYVGFTTRPMREGEQNGREYYFTTLREMEKFEEAGKLIEKRVYHTIKGDWYYFSVDTEAVDLQKDSFLYIGTLESYIPLRDYYGAEQVVPLFINVDDGVRLERALQRELIQPEPQYEEMCRRFLLDAEDFREYKIRDAGISKVFENDDLDRCTEEIRSYILDTVH